MSAILKDNKIFIHIPRTGGSYLLSIMDSLKLLQYTFKEPHLTPDFFMCREPTIKFGFVRHPWSWLHSYFDLKLMIGIHEKIELDRAIILSNYNFDKWIQIIYRDMTPVVGNYMHMFTVGLDFIGKYENLYNDFKSVVNVPDLDRIWFHKAQRTLIGSTESYELVMRCDSQFVEKYYGNQIR